MCVGGGGGAVGQAIEMCSFHGQTHYFDYMNFQYIIVKRLEIQCHQQISKDVLRDGISEMASIGNISSQTRETLLSNSKNTNSQLAILAGQSLDYVQN